MANKMLLMLLFVLPVAVAAQGVHELRGSVASGGSGLASVFVINKTDYSEVKTNSDGKFAISASAGDIIVIYHPDIAVQEITVTAELLKTGLAVDVLPKPYELEEVRIDGSWAINSESLGIVPKGQKKYTTAERRLYTAGDLKWIHLLGLLGGSFPVDPLINAISGRTKLMKKYLAQEKKEMNIEKITGLFPENGITHQFGIPEKYALGFVYYLAEDKGFADAMQGQEASAARLLMAPLAARYLELIAEAERIAPVTEPGKQ